MIQAAKDLAFLAMVCNPLYEQQKWFQKLRDGVFETTSK